jgi:hypothetical protein
MNEAFMITRVLVLLLVAAGGAAAQDEFDRSQNAACTGAISPGSMARVGVSAGVYASLGINEFQPVLAAAAAFTSGVAVRARSLLGGRVDSLPPGEPTITWQGADGALRVTAYRDGRMTWAPRDSATVPPFSDGITFLGRALSMARDSGLAFAMPAEVTADSVIFHIGLYTPTFTRDGKVSHPSVESPVALFHVNQPWFEPARVTRAVSPRHPGTNGPPGTIRRLELAFVVDTTGRVDKTSITDARARAAARLTGDAARGYKSFFDASARALESTRFEPARIGGCPVRQRQVQSFEFKFR